MSDDTELLIIPKDKVLADRIRALELKIGVKKTKYCYLVVSNTSPSGAMIEAFGYKDQTQMMRLLDEKNDTGQLIALLKEELNGASYKALKMDKTSRIEHILATTLQAHHAYLATGEAAHGAVYMKGMTILNSMTGDNAPTQVQHLVSITHQQLEDMSHSERTEAYKRMMSGKLELLDKPVTVGSPEEIE